ncbi:MAG: tetratricopeptide repeat protein [Deltaproteobacteria bacterium]|nr:tetratricopeptide repeat protein [Deltaproteobacteria bacterium]
MISASGIAIEAPEALPGKQHRLSADSVRLLAAGKPAQARPILERLARLEATEARIPYGLAVADFLEAKDEEARKHLAQALELAPDYAEAHLLAGYLEQLGGRAAEALAHYQAFLKTEAAGPRAEDVRTLAQRLGAAP